MKKLYNSASRKFYTNTNTYYFIYNVNVINNYYDIFCVEAQKISNIFIANQYFPQKSFGPFELRNIVYFIDRLLLRKINEKTI